MKAEKFYFWNLEPTQSLQRFVLSSLPLFLPFMVDLTFGKILNIQKDREIHSR